MAHFNNDCPICGGAGVVACCDVHTTPINHPDYGKVKACPACSKGTWDASVGIAEAELPSLNWDEFYPTTTMNILKPALESLLAKGYGWLYIYGSPGIGKTLAVKAASVVAHFKYKYKTKYITHTRLVNYLRTSYDEDRGQIEYSNRLDTLCNTKLLVLDELGRDRINDFSRSSLSDILDNRYTDAIYKKTMTAMVSNFAPKDILDDYQQDRVFDKRFYVLELKDDKSVRSRASYNNDKKEDEEQWWNKI